MGELTDALAPLADVCEQLGLRLQVGGSVATSAYGVARTTLDVDVVIDLPLALAARFVRALEDEYLVELEAVKDAVRRRASFNVIHERTVIKIDVFIPAAEGFGRESFRRGIRDSLDPSDQARTFVLATPEDMILHKLLWYELGHRIATRQWDDVVGVVAVNRASLDWGHIERWARVLAVDDLVDELLSTVAR